MSLCCYARAVAATFADYRHRVTQAIAIVEQLQAAYDDEDPSAQQRVHTSAARIRGELPPKETVALGAQSVVVDNSWLEEALHNYENFNRSSHRPDLLSFIAQRFPD